MNFLLQTQHIILRLGYRLRWRACTALFGTFLVRHGSNFKFVSDWLYSFGSVEVGDVTIILKESRIFRRSIVATGAVATKSFTPYLIIGGAPASLIGPGWDEVIFSRHDEMIYPEGCRADTR